MTTEKGGASSPQVERVGKGTSPERKRMKRRRILLIVTAVVLVSAVSGLVFALSQRDKAGKENTIESENKNTIENENKSESKSESEGENKSEGAGENKNEAEIKIEYELPEVPEGSILVWQRTAEYKDSVLAGEYTYDEYGRCVKKEMFVFGYPDWLKETTIEYDEVTHQTTETSLYAYDDGRIYQKECRVYSGNGDVISSCEWRVEEDRLVKSLGRFYEPYADGKYEHIANVWYGDGYVVQVEWWEYSEDRRSRFYREADLKGAGEKCTDNDDWPTIRAAAERNGVLTAVEEYDEQGRIVAKFDVWNDGTREQVVGTVYFDDGSMKQTDRSLDYCIIYSVDPDRVYPVRYWDAQGRLLRENFVHEDTGKVLGSIEYEYEELPSGGYRQNRYSTREGVQRKLTGFWEYDKNDTETKTVEIDDDGQEVITHLVTFDDQGRVIREEWPSDGVIEWKYDQYGNCVKIKNRSPWRGGGTTTEYVYTPIVLEKDKVAYAESFYDLFRNHES